VSRLDAQRTWLLYQGVGALALAVGWTIAAIYFVREVGMSPLELILAGTALEVAYFLFEVPTGAVGNAFGIRAALAAGAAAPAPAPWLCGRAIRHHGREAELERLPGAAGA
jgi:MFS transporter, DHA3 family, tetracycline resistance protein